MPLPSKIRFAPEQTNSYQPIRSRNNSFLAKKQVNELNWQQEIMQNNRITIASSESLPLWAGPLPNNNSKSSNLKIAYSKLQHYSHQSQSGQTWQQRELINSHQPTTSHVPVAFGISNPKTSYPKENRPTSARPLQQELESDLPTWYDLERDGEFKVSIGGEGDEGDEGREFERQLQHLSDRNRESFNDSDLPIGGKKRVARYSFDSNTFEGKVRCLHQASPSLDSSSESNSIYSTSNSNSRSSTPSLISSSPNVESHQFTSSAFAAPHFFLYAPEACDLEAPTFTKAGNKKFRKVKKVGGI